MENHSACSSANPRTGISPSTSDIPAAAPIDSAPKPTYAGLVAKWLKQPESKVAESSSAAAAAAAPLPENVGVKEQSKGSINDDGPSTQQVQGPQSPPDESLLEHITECSSATNTPLLVNNSNSMGEGLKLSSESNKDLTDGLSSLQLQDPQSVHSPSQKQVNQQQTSQSSASPNCEQASATHGTTSATGSHNSSENPRTGISPSTSDIPAAAPIDSAPKPTYAGLVAKWLKRPEPKVAESSSAAAAAAAPLPENVGLKEQSKGSISDDGPSTQQVQGPQSPPDIANDESLLEHITECSSATTTPSLVNNSNSMGEGLKLSSEPCKDLTDGLSSLQLQDPQSLHSPSQKQVSQQQTSQSSASLNCEQPSATHGTTSATGSHSSSFRRNTPRRSTAGRNTHWSSHGSNFHRTPSGWQPPPLLPPPPPPLLPAPYSYPQYFPGPLYLPRPLVMPPMQPYGVPYGFPSDLGYGIPYHATQLPPPPPPLSNPFVGAGPYKSFVGTPYYVESTWDYSMNVITSDFDLPHEIVKQVDYYFSIDNLAKDIHLRKQMDHEAGWVPITLVADFPRMRRLTDNVQLIVNALQSSSIIEISDGDRRIRRRGDWERWILRS